MRELRTTTIGTLDAESVNEQGWRICALISSRDGAVPVAREDTTFGVRITQRLQEKRAICAAALSFLERGLMVFMDAGSTSSTMAEALAGPTGLTDLPVGAEVHWS